MSKTIRKDVETKHLVYSLKKKNQLLQNVIPVFPLRRWQTLGSYSTRKNIIQTSRYKTQGLASHYGSGHLGNLQSSPHAPYNHPRPCNSAVSCNKTLQWMNVYSFIKVRPGFWIMPPEIQHSSSLLHTKAEFPFAAKVSAVCTDVKSISGGSTCKTERATSHSKTLWYKIQLNSFPSVMAPWATNLLSFFTKLHLNSLKWYKCQEYMQWNKAGFTLSFGAH